MRIDQSLEIVQIKKNETDVGGFARGFDKTIQIAVQVTRVVETRDIIRDGQLHDAIVFLLQLKREPTHAEQVGHPGQQFLVVDGAHENVVAMLWRLGNPPMEEEEMEEYMRETPRKWAKNRLERLGLIESSSVLWSRGRDALRRERARYYPERYRADD